MRLDWVVRAVVVASLAGATTTCTGNDATSESAVAPDIAFEPEAVAGETRAPEIAALPLTALLVKPGTFDEALYLATESAIDECMEARGFHYEIAPYTPTPEFSVAGRPFGPWTSEEVDQTGYDLLETPMVQPNDEYTETLSTAAAEAWYEALLGGQSGTTDQITVELVDGEEVETGFQDEFREGCIFEAQSDVTGIDPATYEAYRWTVQEWSHEAWNRTEASDVVQQAVNAWKSCMDDAGYGYEHPEEVLEEFTAPGLQEDELVVGRTDTACKDSANLHDAWYATQQENEQEIVDQHLEVIAEFTRILDSIRSAVM